MAARLCIEAAELNRRAGFTLFEMTAAIAVTAILVTIAVPAYTDTIRAARIEEAFTNLTAFSERQQAYWNANGSYGPSACAIGAMPPPSRHFSYVCSLNQARKGYLITAVGEGDVQEHNFTIDAGGNRLTTRYPGISGLPVSCWLDRPGHCY